MKVEPTNASGATRSEPTSVPPSAAPTAKSLTPAERMRVTAAESLAELARTTSANRGSVMILRPDTGRLHGFAAFGLPAHLQGKEIMARPHSISEWVFRHRLGLVLNGAVRDERFVGSAMRDGLQSSMCAPLQTAHGALGVINLARYSPADDFSEAELTKLTDSLGPFALQVDELWREERAMRSYDALEVADRDPHRTLVPEGPSEFGNWQIALARRPGWDLGGDLCDRAPHANGTNTMFVADVSGRGALAAQSASLTQGLFVGAAAAQRSASGLVSQMNAGLQPRAGEGRYVALWLAQLSRKGEVTYCNAGYPPPLWIPGDGSEVRRLERGGPVIGMLPQTRYEEETLQLLPGDLLIVASDAVIDARDADEEAFGAYLLAETLQKLRHQPLDRVTKSLMEAALTFSGRSSPSDDLVVLAICYQPER